MSKKLLLLVVVSALWGCNEQKHEAAPLNEQVQERTQVDVKPIAEESTPDATVEEAVVAKKAEEKPKKRLNLSIPDLSLSQEAQSQGTQEPDVLPDMFEKRQAATSVGGEILRNEDNENYLESIDGARVNIEIKTN